MIKTSETFRSAIVGSPRRIEILAVVDISDPDTVFGAVSGSTLACPAALTTAIPLPTTYPAHKSTSSTASTSITEISVR